MQTKADKYEPAAGAQRSAPAGGSGPDQQWLQVRDRFLAAVDTRLRPIVTVLLRQPHYGGPGLRVWLRAVAAKGASLPVSIPPELIQAYLNDPEAMPLHECEDCGLAVPVRPGREYGREGEPERVYFATCPCCGGHTGLYAYFSGVRRPGADRPTAGGGPTAGAQPAIAPEG